MTEPTPEEQAIPTPRPFSEFLFAQRGGATHAELTDGMAALAEQVMETGKGGTLTLRIAIQPASKSGGHQMLVADEVVVKAPKAKRTESIFFFDAETGSLSRNDPLQPQLPLQEVPARPTTLKEAR
ncbi:hypothetical protein KSP35_13165 [Aquihabitans sp. G128]|uniref:hypothetical protein n=1 Tax=Aquihabitans sp. G128 TaxID=2849779 RepID=UPI001C22A6A9|nr:hypothetical protein [Aquihabitans sp. G128]QXC59353.1 hypothetical protein KSP35_13165 [Aquihabitans sp. G128]